MIRLASLCVASAALFLLSCGESEPAEPAPPAPRVLLEKQPPKATPISPNPERRKLDEQGDLIESMNDLYGFRLPVGVDRVSQADGEAVLRISTHMGRLVRFYTSRGYQVVEGKGGFTVTHSRATLADQSNPDSVRAATLYLRPGTGRQKELRFYAPPRPDDGVPDGGQPLDLEPPADDAPEDVKAAYERVQRWKKAHPGEPLYY